MQIDTGSTCCTLKLAEYRTLTDKPLEKSVSKLILYDKSVVYPVGKTKLYCKSKGGRAKVNFEVVEKAPTSLLISMQSVYFALTTNLIVHLIKFC